MRKPEKRKSYLQIAYDLHHRILSNEFSLLQKLPTRRELAQYYQSSVNTIAKALKYLENKGIVKSENRVGTLIINELRNDNRNRLIASCIISIDNPLWMSALRGAEDTLRSKGYSMITISHDRDSARLMKALNDMTNTPLDGMIIAPIHQEGEPDNQFVNAVNSLLERSVPLVFVDRSLPLFSVPCVTTDNSNGAYRLTRMLIDNGHRNIAFVRINHVSTIEERYSGFRRACYDAQLKKSDIHDFFIKTKQEDFQDEFDQFSHQLEQLLVDHNVSALFTANDQIAKAVLYTLKRMHIHVPDDISVVTYDSINLSQTTPYRITGMQQNFYEIGRIAAEVLLQKIRGELRNSSLEYIVPSDLILYDSIRNLHTDEEASNEYTQRYIYQTSI
ncbi:MAG: GntR family transcriptional regulator [Christensenellales bacterium]